MPKGDARDDDEVLTDGDLHLRTPVDFPLPLAKRNAFERIPVQFALERGIATTDRLCWRSGDVIPTANRGLKLALQELIPVGQDMSAHSGGES